jgi:hypothetical protein
MYRSSTQLKRAFALAAISGLFASPLPSPSSTAAAAEPDASVAPVQVDAVYKVALNGFELGKFRFGSNVTPYQYTVDTDVELSALLGVFHWKGVTRSSGTFAAKQPQPAGFLFQFESSARSGSIKLGFEQGAVQEISVLPEEAETPDTVPLQAVQLKGVLDPLSAIMALTHNDGATPCGRKLQIFDGKQRFDLDLRFSREQAIDGQPDKLTVCRVKYTPLGGYRATEETQTMAANTGIEIAFRRVPSAKLMLPQTVTVPTAAGVAELTLETVDIKTPGRGKVALVN